MTTRAWGKFLPYGTQSPVWVRMDTITSVTLTSNESATVCAGRDAYHIITDDAQKFVTVLMRDLSSITQRTRALTDYTGAIK